MSSRRAAVSLAITEWLLLLAIPLLATVLWALTTQNWALLTASVAATVVWAVASLIVTRGVADDDLVLDLTAPTPRPERPPRGTVRPSRTTLD